LVGLDIGDTGEVINPDTRIDKNHKLFLSSFKSSVQASLPR
jgi:hypothetical protein